MHRPGGKPFRFLLGSFSVMTRQGRVRCGKSRPVVWRGGWGRLQNALGSEERVAIYLLVFGAFQGRYRILHFKGSLRFPNELLSLRKPISVCLLFNRCVGRQRAVLLFDNGEVLWIGFNCHRGLPSKIKRRVQPKRSTHLSEM
jgi:hypothetical protein